MNESDEQIVDNNILFKLANNGCCYLYIKFKCSDLFVKDRFCLSTISRLFSNVSPLTYVQITENTEY